MHLEHLEPVSGDTYEDGGMVDLPGDEDFDTDEDDCDDQDITPETFQHLKDDYGDFLGRLESVHHVSQAAVQEIAAEVLNLSNRVLTHTLDQVSKELGSLFFYK